jgi:hypothetical protein
MRKLVRTTVLIKKNIKLMSYSFTLQGIDIKEI